MRELMCWLTGGHRKMWDFGVVICSKCRRVLY